MKEYGREQFSDITGQYLSPYVYGRKFLDTRYGIRKEDGAFKIGDRWIGIAMSGLKASVLEERRACGNY